MTAATDNTPALEGYRGHGVFTYALLDAFGQADVNGDGVIDITELASYVDRVVPEVSFAAFNSRQVPQMKIVGSNFSLVNRLPVLSAEPASASPVPIKPIHVVIAPASVHDAPAGNSATVLQLIPGSQVVLVKTANGWALVARDGKKLGYVEENALVRLQ